MLLGGARVHFATGRTANWLEEFEVVLEGEGMTILIRERKLARGAT